MSHQQFLAHIDEHFERPSEALDDSTRALVRELLQLLNDGRMRAASRQTDGRWTPDLSVKKGILLAFRVGRVRQTALAPFQLSDKDTLPLRHLDVVGHNIRVVPGGTSIREGTYIGRNITIMPPAYVNVGAYIDDDTLIDSHALVGSCAQIGRRVHLSAAAQIGGVLEPIGQVPVIIEDGVLVGGNAGIYEGTIVRQGAVIGAGTILTASTRLYDLVEERVIGLNGDGVLEVPANAVVVPGARPARGPFAEEHGLHLYSPVIVKYRDGKTDARAALEEALR